MLTMRLDPTKKQNSPITGHDARNIPQDNARQYLFLQASPLAGA